MDGSHTTEFKHDTDNLTIITIVIFSVCAILFTIAICLVIFRYTKEGEFDKKVVSQKSEKLENLKAYENKNLSGMGTLETEEGKFTFIPIEQAMNKVIKKYNP